MNVLLSPIPMFYFPFFPARTTPFTLKFHTDEDEGVAAGPAGAANTDELDTHPGGIIGFSLYYIQKTC